MDNLGIIKAITQILNGLSGKNNVEKGNSNFNFGGILDALKNFNLNGNKGQTVANFTPNSTPNNSENNAQNQDKNRANFAGQNDRNFNTTFDKNLPQTNAEKRAYLPPLQTGMITVMDSHDKFIKRVMSRTDKTL